jgi:ATP-binding cassette, subfamily B, bacterial
VPLKVSENIGVGDIDNREASHIEKAARNAGADPFIQKLPEKYDTPLRGKRNFPYPTVNPRRSLRMSVMARNNYRHDFNSTDNSVELSGGQWQRLALSRAFMRGSGADLLILDEPSSSLDPEAEHTLFRIIQRVRRNRTTIYVTHRFYTVRMATKIAFLEEGRLIEWGGHDELMAIPGGKYAKLFQLQSEGFSTLGRNEGGEEE